MDDTLFEKYKNIENLSKEMDPICKNIKEEMHAFDEKFTYNMLKIENEWLLANIQRKDPFNCKSFEDLAKDWTIKTYNDYTKELWYKGKFVSKLSYKLEHKIDGHTLNFIAKFYVENDDGFKDLTQKEFK